MQIIASTKVAASLERFLVLHGAGHGLTGITHLPQLHNATNNTAGKIKQWRCIQSNVSVVGFQSIT